MNKAVIIILIVLVVVGGAFGIMYAAGVFGTPGEDPGNGGNPPSTECEHEWELLTEKKPACLTDGYKNLVCSICGAEETQVLVATGHNLSTTKAVAPTCYSEGKTEKKTCKNITSGCTYSEGGETVPMLAHTWVSTPEKAATCTEDGYIGEGEHCAVCFLINEECKPEIVTALGHDYQPVDRVEPTCASDGYIGGTACSRCGQIGELPTEILPKSKEHTAELVVVTTATCSADGYSECPVCKERVLTEYRSSDKHLWSLETEAVAASCKDQTDGTTAVYKCTAPGCGATVGGQTVEWETLHTDDANMNWQTEIEATKTNAGERVGTCSVCGVVIREDIPMISDSDFNDDNNIYPDDVVGSTKNKDEDEAA